MVDFRVKLIDSSSFFESGVEYLSCTVSGPAEQNVAGRIELDVVNRFLVDLERVDPGVVAVHLARSDRCEVDLPQVDLSVVRSTCDESLGAD